MQIRSRPRVRKQIPDLTDAEFARGMRAGLLEHQVIDGSTLYFNRAPSNLFRLSAEAHGTPQSRSRRSATARWRRSIRTTARSAMRRGPHNAAACCHCGARHPDADRRRRRGARRRNRACLDSVSARDSGPAGRHPFHRQRPAAHQIAPESALQRTVYLEKPAQAGQPTKFSITYELTIYASTTPSIPTKWSPPKITPELAPFVAERRRTWCSPNGHARVLAKGRRR